MFTGIVEHQVKILDRRETDGLFSFDLSTPKNATLAIGSSVLLNGICSTITKFSKRKFSVDYMPETRKKTNVDTWSVGNTVHMETSLRMGDTIDGHFVFGHIDTVAKVVGVRRVRDTHDISLSLPKKWMRYFVSKGSVAIDGVSLTVVNVGAYTFSVSLIPHTLKETHLGNLQKDDTVNVECDMLAKYASRAVPRETINL